MDHTVFFYTIIVIKHDFNMHYQLLGPSGGVKILVFQARVFITSLGAQQMLRYRKSCLIPILRTQDLLACSQVCFSHVLLILLPDLLV